MVLTIHASDIATMLWDRNAAGNDMNERIKELAKQAEQYALDKANEDNDEDYDYSFDDDFQEKFAELIVLECLSYAKDGDLDFMKFMIKKNFGVEE